jgi:hypothetical protein
MRGVASLRALVAVAVLAPAWACDCPPTTTQVDAGQAVGGFVPSTVVAPWLGNRPGTLTWLTSGTTTPLHLDVEQPGPTTSTITECGDFSDKTPFFQAFLTAHVTTDDGTIDATGADTLGFGPDGRVLNDLNFVVSPTVPAAQAGRVEPGVVSDLDIEFTIDDHAGKPQGTTVTACCGPPPWRTVGRIDFAP